MSSSSKPTKKEVMALVFAMQKAGIYEKDMQARLLEQFDYRSLGGGPPLEIERSFEGRRMLFDIRLQLLSRPYRFDGYMAFLPERYRPYRHFEHQGVKTWEIEQRMARLDWKSFPPHGITQAQRDANPMYREMYAVLADLEALEKMAGRYTRLEWGENDIWFDLLQTSQGMMVKYLSDTPLEGVVGSGGFSWKPTGLQGAFFPPETNINVPGRYAADIEELKKLSAMAQQESINHPKNQFIMNLNNLEDRKDEMQRLEASPATIAQMEEKMRQGLPNFKLMEVLPARRGHVEVAYLFNQGKNSDSYYLSRYSVAHMQAKPLAEGEKYMMIIPPAEQGGKNTVKSFEFLSEALQAFKEFGGTGELAVGRDAAHKTQLALSEAGKVNYVQRDFRGTFYGTPPMQPVWPERGKGFTVPQMGQMIQGKAVYRDDLVNYSSGVIYQAWVLLDLDKGLGDKGRFDLQQYHVPQYGFVLEDKLAEFKIKEMETPEKAAKLIRDLQNGFTPVATVERQDGEKLKVEIEAVPRYSTLNFYSQDGRIEKREQFLKDREVAAEIGAGKGKEKGREQDGGMAVGA